MNKENICFSSKTIELAENENYIELTNRLCYYTEPNLNGVALVYDEFSNEKAQTLVDMPVVAKYTTNSKGEPTFKGHEVYYDEDGNLYFGTDNIGTHTATYIKDDTVIIDLKGTTKVLPCLFAKYRVWKRNQNVVDAIHRLYDLDKLYSSWEIQTLSYTYNNGIKTLIDYVFLSNCLLGYENAYPAYGEDAKGISMSQKESQLLVAEAFSKDIIEHSVSNININQKEEENMSDIAEILDSDATETSLLIDRENKCETSTEDNADTVVANETVENTIENSEIETLTSQLETKTKEIEVLNTTLAELNSKVDALTDSLVEASTKIQSLNKDIAELTPYKESFEQAEQARIEKETSTKRENLKKFAIDSKFISETELSSDETIKICIDNVDEKGLKAIIAERFVKSLDIKTENASSKEVETSSIINSVETPKANITDSDIEVSSKSIMKKYLNK